MTALQHQRLLRLEAGGYRASLSADERAKLSADLDRVLGLAPPGADRETYFRELLRRVDCGFATDEELARVGGVNLEVMRIVSDLYDSDFSPCPTGQWPKR